MQSNVSSVQPTSGMLPNLSFEEMLTEAKNIYDEKGRITTLEIINKFNVDFACARKIFLAMKNDPKHKRIIEIQKMKIPTKDLN